MSQQMTYGGHARAIMVLGLPLVGGHIAQIALSITDTVMLGWYGVEALAAVTLASSYFFAIFIMGGGFAFAVMPMVASFNAADDEVSLRRVTRMGLWLSMMFAALAMPLMWWSHPILLALGQEEHTALTASQYLRVAGWGFFPGLAAMVIRSYLAAMERTQIVLWIALAGVVVNAIANYALIFGNWGAPELGATGAAIASLATMIFSFLGMLFYAARAFPEHSMFQRLWRADWEMFARVFHLGWPISMTNLSETGLFAATAVMMGWLGTVPLAAHGIAMTLAGLTFMVHLGVSNAATIRAGNAFGRGDRTHMARGGHVAIAMSLAMSAATIVLFLSLPEPLIKLFLDPAEPDREAILAVGVGLLAMAALFQLVDGAQAIALGLLRGVQDTGVPMVIAAISYWVVGMPAGYVLGFVYDLGGIGVWFGLVVGLSFAGVLLMARFWGQSIKQVGV